MFAACQKTAGALVLSYSVGTHYVHPSRLITLMGRGYKGNLHKNADVHAACCGMSNNASVSDLGVSCFLLATIKH